MKYIIFRIIFLIGFLNLIGCNSRDDQKVFVIAGQSNASGVGDSGKSVFVPNKKVFEYNSLLDTLEVLKDPVGQNHLNFQVAQTGSFIPALAYKYSELSISFPDIEFCTDNAAMIAAAGYYKILNKQNSSYNLRAIPNLLLGK